MSEDETALIHIAPGRDQEVVDLHHEALKLLQYARQRTIESTADLALATEDVSLIAGLKKALEARRKAYIEPIQTHLAVVNSLFKEFTAPLNEADELTRRKIMEYRAEQNRLRAEAEAIEAEKEALARREATLKHGEITVDLTPVDKPEAPPDRIRTGFGTASTANVRKWEIVDFAAVPDEFKQIDAGKVTRLVKAGIGAISGIRIWKEETLRVTPRKEEK